MAIFKRNTQDLHPVRAAFLRQSPWEAMVLPHHNASGVPSVINTRVMQEKANSQAIPVFELYLHVFHPEHSYCNQCSPH